MADRSQNLRLKAEKLLAQRGVLDKSLYTRNLEELVEELSIFQIELEYQNDELLRTQMELENNRQKYADLFDMAPVGYVVMTDHYEIVELNATFCNITECKSDDQKTRRITRYIAPDSQDEFYLFLREVRKTGVITSIELWMNTFSGKRFRARIGARLLDKASEPEGVLWFITVEDISAEYVASQKLHLSEAKFRGIFEQSPVGVEIYSADGKLIHINRAGEEIFGLQSSDDVLGFSLFKDPNIPVDALDRLRRGEVVHYEFTFDFDLVHKKKLYPTSKSGLINLDCLITPWFDGEGSIAGYLLLIRDITDQKAAADLVFQSRETLSDIFETVSDGLAYTTLSGQVIQINPALEKILGVPASEVVGRNILQVSKQFLKPRYLKNVIPLLTSLISGKEIPSFQVTINDRIVEVKTAINRKSRRLTGLIRDITELVEGQRQVTENEEKFRNIFNASSFAVFIHDNDFNIIDCNETALKMFGYRQKDEIIRAGFSLLSSDNDQNADVAVNNYLAQVLKNRKASFDCQARMCSGELFWVHVEVQVVHIAQKQQILAIVSNIQEQKTASDRLRDSEAKYRALVENAAEGILIAQDGLFRFVNPAMCQMLKRTEKQLIDSDFIQYIHPDDRQMVMDKYTRRMRGEHVETGYSFRILASDGEIRHVWIRSNLIEWNGNAATLNLLSDITDLHQQELKIKESEATLKKAQETAHLGSWTWFIQEDRVEWSDEMCRIFGVDRQQFTGNLSDVISQIIHPEDRDKIEESNAMVMELKRPEPLEYRIVLPDNSIRYIYAEAGELMNDAEGRPVLLTGIAQDITGHKTIEIELRRREHLLDRIFDVLPIGLWISDGKGRLIRSNPVGRKIWGAEPLVSPEDYGVFKAKRLSDGQPVQPTEWALVKAIENGETTLDELLEIDAFDGVKRIILNSCAPVLGENNNIEAAVIVNQDVTQLRELSEKLVKSEEKFKLIAEKASDVVWLMDLQGRSLFVSPSIEKFTGFTQEEYLQQSIPERFTPDSAKRALETMQQELQAYAYLKKIPDDFAKVLVLEYRCKDGSVKSGELLITPYFDESGHLTGLHGVTRDVTDRQRIMKELEELNVQLNEKVKERTNELEKKNTELSRMNKLFVGREIRMVELKQRIAELEAKLTKDS